MAQALQGIVINEILADPSGGNSNFDTDGDGRFERNDDFVELYNTTNSPVDVSGWTISNSDGVVFTFPTTDEPILIASGEHVVLVGEWNGTQPQPSYVFEAGGRFLGDGGDEVILSDGSATIAAVYGNVNSSSHPFDDLGNVPGGRSVQRSPDGSDTLVRETPTPECFVTGTLITTAQGEIAVEYLTIGDRVKTADGQLAAIKWIGRQTVKPETVQNPMRGYPILVKAGALGNSLPVRDLCVSPDHALFVDGLLINAGALVNGMSIIQTEPEDTFTYFHVELEQHALLIAEGTYAESYLPQKEDRNCYDNASEYNELYPEGPSVILWPMDYPRVSSYTTVPRYVRKRLNQIAQTLCLQEAIAS